MLVNSDYYYSHGFLGAEDNVAELEAALLNAERKINIATSGKCEPTQLAKLCDRDLSHLKQAVCCQTEEDLYYNAPEFKVKIGDFSFENNNSRNGRTSDELISPLAYGILKFGGLISVKAEAR
jgi:hypothetical protein